MRDLGEDRCCRMARSRSSGSRSVRIGAQSRSGGSIRRSRRAERRRHRAALPDAVSRGARRRPPAVLLHAGSAAQPPRRAARQGADRDAPTRRAAALRPGAVAGPIDAVCHRVDARGVRCAVDDRQYVFPQALLRFARPLQHHAQQRTAHHDGGRDRLAAADGAVRIRNGLERLPLDLSSRRPRGQRARNRVRRRPGMQWRIMVEGEPCRFLVFGHLVLGDRELEQEGTHRGGPRSQALRFPARPQRAVGAALPATRSTIWSPARPRPSRRSAETSCSTRMGSSGADPMSRSGRCPQQSFVSPSWGR